MLTEANAPAGTRVAVDRSHRGIRRPLTESRGARKNEGQLVPVRFRLDLGYDKAIRAARQAIAGQRFVLLNLDREGGPRTLARFERDGVGGIVRICAAGDDQTAAGRSFRRARTVQAVVEVHWLVVEDLEHPATG